MIEIKNFIFCVYILLCPTHRQETANIVKQIVLQSYTNRGTLSIDCQTYYKYNKHLFVSTFLQDLLIHSCLEIK